MSIYQQSKFCVYLTTYSGNKMPPFYIGYTLVEKIKKGYRGSVKSKKYIDIWKSEQKNNPHLFKTIILSVHVEKIMALKREEFLQKQLSVDKNELYINQAISGKNFTYNKGRKLSREHKEKIGRANSISLKGRKLSEETKEKQRRPKHTEEFKKKMSILHKNNKHALGRKKTKEQKEHLRLINKDKKHTQKTKEKISKSKKDGAYKHSQETKSKISKTLKDNTCRAKKYTITYSNGDIREIFNLKKFCVENKMHYTSVVRSFKEKRKYKDIFITELSANT